MNKGSLLSNACAVAPSTGCCRRTHPPHATPCKPHTCFGPRWQSLSRMVTVSSSCCHWAAHVARKDAGRVQTRLHSWGGLLPLRIPPPRAGCPSTPSDPHPKNHETSAPHRVHPPCLEQVQAYKDVTNRPRPSFCRKALARGAPAAEYARHAALPLPLQQLLMGAGRPASPPSMDRHNPTCWSQPQHVHVHFER